MSSAYQPQLDRPTKALNKCLELYLRCFISANPKAWVDWLPWAQLWYNSAFHSSESMAPFKVVYGRDSPQLIPYCSNDKDHPEISALLQQRDDILLQLKQNLIKA